FTKTGTRYQISKSIRDLCVFAKQNIAADPPFSRLDFISCRNVLIYLESVLQKKVMPIFHYALKPGGFFLLGNSETVGSFTELFTPVDKTHRIYVKKGVPSRIHFEFSGGSYQAYDKIPVGKKGEIKEESTKAPDILREADRLVLSRYAPAGVLVDD